jgi:hypothetical protein
MKPLLVAVILLLVAGCGGGGGSRPDPIPQPPVAKRTDVLLGYYWGNAAAASETADHANLYWATFGYGEPAQVEGIRAAKAAGQRVVLMLWHGMTEEQVSAFLERLKNLDLLGPVAALYYFDEPDLMDLQESFVVEASAMLRRSLARFPEMKDTKLAVFYACKSGMRPGLHTFDWVGCDDYDSGCGVLGQATASLRGAMTLTQRLMIIPGGGSPWRQDPACFEDYAHANPVVVAVVPFLWQSVEDRGNTYQGIKENGMADAYRAAGKRLTGR